MAKIEVNNSGWNSITDKRSGLGKLGSILSMIPTEVTQVAGKVMSGLEAARNHDGGGLLMGAVSSMGGGEKPGGGEASFGKEVNEAQGMFGDKNMNVGGLRTAGKTPTLGSMH